MKRWTREAVVEVAKRVGSRHGGALTSVQLRDEGGISARVVDRLFSKGGFLELRRAAGLKRGEHPLKVRPERALEEFHRVAKRLGGVPSWSLFKRHGRFGPEVLIKRFGGRAALMAAYDRWLKVRGEERAGPGVWRDGAGRRAAGSRGGARIGAMGNRNAGVGVKVRWKGGRAAGEGIRKVREAWFGAPLDFRGLLHEPTNEAGVVFLFGALGAELGFLVDGFRPTFPDCDAKRRERGGRWRRVLIEFEFLSSNFVSHRHDPAGCDLIVCWEHDWPDCPLEVIELRREVARLAVARPRLGPVPAPGNGRHPPGRPTGRPS